MKQILIFSFFLISAMGFGQQLVYSAKNPAFGGDPFNYQWLLNSANAQNSFKDPSLIKDEKTDLEKFTERLNNALLSQLSTQLLKDQFGDNLLAPGTSTFGSLELEIFDSSQGLVINILDTNTGDQTQIIIPN